MEWIDKEVLAQLGQDTGEELLPDLVAIFVEDGKVTLQALEQALISENAEELLLLAHTLKSVSATYGAIICHEQAQALELACRRLDWPTIRQGVSLLQQSLPASSAQLQSLVVSLSPI